MAKKKQVFVVALRSETGKKVKNLRKNGIVPGSIFGPSIQPLNISIKKQDLITILSDYGYNKFFNVTLDNDDNNQVRRVLLKDIQVHPVTDEYLSFSLYQISENRKIIVDIPIKFIGEAPVEKLNIGFLVYQYTSLRVHCYPKDIVDYIEVDISNIQKETDTILVSSVALPSGLELDSSIDTSAAIVYVATAQKVDSNAVNDQNQINA
ncbi:MAG: 50S ribosomal protein L25 [Candidatus Dojkabacteria bacterium]|nr:50S ribosomal protein L25 [Candidatus Dojkabacteria bacterium]